MCGVQLNNSQPNQKSDFRRMYSNCRIIIMPPKFNNLKDKNEQRSKVKYCFRYLSHHRRNRLPVTPQSNPAHRRPADHNRSLDSGTRANNRHIRWLLHLFRPFKPHPLLPSHRSRPFWCRSRSNTVCPPGHGRPRPPHICRPRHHRRHLDLALLKNKLAPIFPTPSPERPQYFNT